jgi:hypothetical protein
MIRLAPPVLRVFLVGTVLWGGLPPCLWAQREAPRPGEVTLALPEYLALVERVERVERERARQAAQREEPLAEVVAQETAVSLRLSPGDARAEMVSRFEVLVQGAPKTPARLPLGGYPQRVEIRKDGKPVPAAAVSSSLDNGLSLMAPEPGRYSVELASVAPVENRGGIWRLPLAPAAAAVAVTEVELPADLAWTSPGVVVVEDTVQGDRRKVRLASRRGESRVFEVRRKVDGTAAEDLLAQSVVLTLFQLSPDGLRRHDVVLYEVSRGSLPSLTVELPPGLEVERVATDEGDMLPDLSEVGTSRRLTVHRRRQLQGTGYLVLTSSPGEGALASGVPLETVRPAVEVRARYLAVSSSVAAEIGPAPEASWARVDLDDLPQALGSTLAALDLSSAWRLSGEAPGSRLAVNLLPAAPKLETTARLRETTTLVTVDGTVLHRDRITLDPPPPAGSALDLTLPAGATLWSAQVGDLPVRPLERDGRVSVPLGFGGMGGKEGEPAVVEVVAVLERGLPPGRSQLGLELAQLGVPVLDHRWRLLLPEGARYRYRQGDLRPAADRGGIVGGRLGGIVGGAPPPAAEPAPQEITEEIVVDVDQIAVTGEPSLRDERKQKEEARRQFAAEAEGLRQGLVGGVKPLPIQIPEDGKLLLLAGVLPPPRVTVELEVRKERR